MTPLLKVGDILHCFYLFTRDQEAGRDEGINTRPVIVIAVQSQRAFTAAIATKSDQAGQELAIPDAVGDPAGPRTARKWSSPRIIISLGSASISASLQPHLPRSPPSAVTDSTASPLITLRRTGCDHVRPSILRTGSAALARDATPV